MSADPLIRRLAHADAALPPPPAQPLSVARLDALLARRRRRDALLLTGLLAVSLAFTALLWPRPARAAGPGIDAAAIDRQLQRLAADLATLRQRLDHALTPQMPSLQAQHDEVLQQARVTERAAFAAVAAADLFASTDVQAAERQRQRVQQLWPDTAAAAQLAARPRGERR